MPSSSEVWLVDFGPPEPSEPAKIRPALVLGPPRHYRGMPTVIVAPMTTRARDIDFHVEVEATERSGLSTTSYVQTEKLRAVGRHRLLRKLGAVDPEPWDGVRVELRSLLGL